MPSHPLLYFLRRLLALGPFHWPTRSILESTTIISGEVRSDEQIDTTSQLTWIHDHLQQRIEDVAHLVVTVATSTEPCLKTQCS